MLLPKLGRRGLLGVVAAMCVIYGLVWITSESSYSGSSAGIRSMMHLSSLSKVERDLELLKEQINHNMSSIYKELHLISAQLHAISSETKDAAVVEESTKSSTNAGSVLRQVKMLAGQRCLDRNDNYPNNEVKIYTCHGGMGGQNQRFWISKEGHLRHPSGYCIDALDSTDGKAVVMGLCNLKSRSQMWGLLRPSNGEYGRLVNEKHELCLDYDTKREVVIASKCSNKCTQKWNVTYTEAPSSLEAVPFVPLHRPKPKIGARILCWVLTHPDSHVQATAVNNTWGRECDTLLFISSETFEGLNIVRMDLGGSESRDLLWSKSQQAWMYMYQHYLDQADWFLKADDDTYVMLPRLRQFLANHSASKPLHFGRRFHYLGKDDPESTYTSGGAGILLSRESLRLLGSKAEKDSSIWAGPSSGPEDQLLSKTLVTNFGIYPADTRDAQGRHLFITLGLEPERAFTRASMPDLWYWQFSKDAKEGHECCSRRWITTHYTSASQMYAIDEIRRSECKADPLIYPYMD